MARRIRYVKAVEGEKPAVRLEFKGPTLWAYFSLRRVARDDFETTQTELGRKIICEWLKRYNEAAKNKEDRIVRQMTLALELGSGKLNASGKTREGAVK